MIIDLSELLSLKGKVISRTVDLELERFSVKYGSYPIADKKPMEFTFTGLGRGKVKLEARLELSLIIPCDRCLEEVKVPLFINTSEEVNLGDTDVTQKSASGDADFIKGTSFDAEKFAYGEILVSLPMKVLCSESCKGICNRCGTNLNHKECGCDTTEPDPRMAKAMEVFKSFKEV